jgi:glycosyltransferase involved in cell wall biosynthesis
MVVMKVLYVNVGITSYLHPLLEKIAAKGFEITMLIPANNDNTIGEGVKLTENQNKSYNICYSRSKKMWYGKHVLIDLKKYLIQEKPDILILIWPYFLHLFFNRSILKLMKKNGISLVIREIPFQTPPYGKLNYFKKHPVYNENMELKSSGIGFYLRQWITMHIRKYLYSKAVATLNYSSVAYDIITSYGVAKENIYVTYNSSDTEALVQERDFVKNEPPLLSPCKYRLLHIGRLVKWKRVDLLIDAVKKLVLSFPSMQLVVVGTGPEETNLKQQVKDYELTDNVLFVGGIYDPKELGKYMNESTVYVLAGMGGLSINDAMTYGLPIICSVCDSTERDLVEHGINGFFFKENDVDSLAQTIKRLLNSPELCKQMGKESERIIRDKINIETVSNYYCQAFKNIIEKQKGSKLYVN